ncbi:MAG: hypothetical protein R3B70_00410 [Polyangiaceae bacterium]
MRPTQKMKRAIALPANAQKKPEQPPAGGPGEAVRARREELRKKHASLREIEQGERLQAAFDATREMVQSLADAARAGKLGQVAAHAPVKGAPGVHAAVPKPVEGAVPASVPDAVAIHEAEKKALAEWSKLEAFTREKLALRLRRVEARERGLKVYEEARGRGLGGPGSRPLRPERT